MIDFFIVNCFFKNSSSQVASTDVLKRRILSNFNLGALSLQLTVLAFCFQNFPFKCGWTRRFAATLFLPLCDLCRAAFISSFVNGVEQAFSCQPTVLRLRARILHGDADSAWPMTQRHGGCNLVYMLSTGPAGTRKAFFQIVLANAESCRALNKRIFCHCHPGLDAASHDPQSTLRSRKCRWPDSNRHGPLEAQRILSPLRLPFRHIGFCHSENHLFIGKISTFHSLSV